VRSGRRVSRPSREGGLSRHPGDWFGFVAAQIATVYSERGDCAGLLGELP
jgi:hypothetical protein